MFKYAPPANIDDLAGRPTRDGFLDDWHAALHRFWRVAPRADVARIENQREGTIAARG